MSIEEMKAKLVESNMKYVHDMVMQDRYEELYDYVETHYFSDFKDIDDKEIIEQYGWLTEHSKEEAWVKLTLSLLMEYVSEKMKLITPRYIFVEMERGVKYTVKFGMARAYYTPELHENTRSKTFTNRKEAESYWDRLDKFTFKDSVFSEFYLIAWKDWIEEYEEAWKPTYQLSFQMRKD